MIVTFFFLFLFFFLPPSDKTMMESVVNFISDVVPQVSYIYSF